MSEGGPSTREVQMSQGQLVWSSQAYYSYARGSSAVGVITNSRGAVCLRFDFERNVSDLTPESFEHRHRLVFHQKAGYVLPECLQLAENELGPGGLWSFGAQLFTRREHENGVVVSAVIAPFNGAAMMTLTASSGEDADAVLNDHSHAPQQYESIWAAIAAAPEAMALAAASEERCDCTEIEEP